jgi:hypothetical protein
MLDLEIENTLIKHHIPFIYVDVNDDTLKNILKYLDIPN